MKPFCRLLLVASSSFHAGAGLASAAGLDWWLGLWEGIDPADGGKVTLSITPADDGIGEPGSNSVNMRFSDTFIRACTSLPQFFLVGFMGYGAPWSKRGVYVGDADIPVDALSFDFPIPIYCFEDETNDPVAAAANIINTLTREGDTVVMSGPLLLPPDGAVRFFRESTKLQTWAGMYRGIDIGDGGILTMDIGEVEGEKNVYDIRFSDTFIRACSLRPNEFLPEGFKGAGPDWSKRGYYVAKAASSTKSGNGKSNMLMSTEDGGTEIDVEIYCFGSEDDAEARVLYGADVKWSFEKAGDVIIMSGAAFDGELLAAGGKPNMRFHQVS